MSGIGQEKKVTEKVEEVPFSKPYFGEEEEREIVATIRSGWLTTGPRTAQFEKEFAVYMNRKYAVGVTSCTAAMHLALLCLDIGSGDEVITSAISWVATPNVIEYVGAKPVFVDVEPDTLNIDARKIPDAISQKTVAILPVHLYGYPCDMGKIINIARRHRLSVVGDCAHSVETEYGARKVGSLGDIDCFSFWAAKNLSCGEGGMIVTDNEVVRERAIQLRAAGLVNGKRDSTGMYSQICLGWKYNMFDLQAALGIHQLRRLENRLAKRRVLADRYTHLLKDVKEVRVLRQDSAVIRHAHHLYPVIVENRAKVAAGLKEKGISTSIHFLPLHLQPYYKRRYGYHEGMFLVAEELGMKVLSLPFWPEMTFEQQDRVVEVLKEVL